MDIPRKEKIKIPTKEAKMNRKWLETALFASLMWCLMLIVVFFMTLSALTAVESFIIFLVTMISFALPPELLKRLDRLEERRLANTLARIEKNRLDRVVKEVKDGVK